MERKENVMHNLAIAMFVLAGVGGLLGVVLSAEYGAAVFLVWLGYAIGSVISGFVFRFFGNIGSDIENLVRYAEDRQKTEREILSVLKSIDNGQKGNTAYQTAQPTHTGSRVRYIIDE